MSEFLVAPEDVMAAAGGLSAIGGGVEDLCGHLAGCSGAASGTPVDGALEDLLGHFSAALPRFGSAGEHLGGAVAGAGTGYVSSDVEVADACGERR